MSQKYRIIGGYHDGEWWGCDKDQIVLAERFSFESCFGEDQEVVDKHHLYIKREFFADGKTTFVWTPSSESAFETMINLINGYEPTKERLKL